jgi:antitoxin SocA-like protein
VVGTLWRTEKDHGIVESTAELGEAELNTIGYVISRYGSLTANDLVNLTHSESPWRTADTIRRPGERVTIRPEWMRQYFATAGIEDDGDDEPLLDSETVSAWLRDAEHRRTTTDEPDDLDALRARLVNDA